MPAHSHSTSLALDANSSTVPDAVEFLVASGVIAGWFLASALIVAWLTAVACLMTLLSTSVHAAAPLARMEATVSQSAFKGDRIDFLRKSANRILIGTEKANPGAPNHAPIGCETAFSKLLHASFSVRCVT